MTLIRLHNDDWGFETNCFVCEPKNDRGLQIPFFHDTERRLVIADFDFSDSFSGAPTLVHGGVTLDTRGVLRVEASATFTTLGDAQIDRIAGVETGEVDRNSPGV